MHVLIAAAETDSSSLTRDIRPTWVR